MGEKILVLIFQSQKGISVRMSVDDLKDDLADNDVKTAMQDIIAKNIFNSSGGDLTSIAGAEIVTRTVEQLVVI